MKLLGWMHRKFRHNSSEPLKDLIIGQTAHDDQQNYQKPNHGTKHSRQTQNRRKSFAGLEAAHDDYEEESSDAISDLFHGFLAIGTLGSDPSSTPTFSISVENITEKEDEVTENELKLINDELEKVLGAETKDDYCNDSSGRNSHVSAGRSSHGSIITLSGKPLEGIESNVQGNSVCPLQGYLFGSAIELSETTTTIAAKKEQRTSLGELFQRSKAEENSGAKFEKEDKREADKSAMNLMKKKLKKRMLLASSRNSNGGPVDPASAETKLHKILHMFHRKVHPETSTIIDKPGKNQKQHEMKKKMMNDVNQNRGDLVYQDEDHMALPKRSSANRKDIMKNYSGQMNPHQFALVSGDSSGNREHWIKTDADYLVLEL